MDSVKAIFSVVCFALVAGTFGGNVYLRECPDEPNFKPLTNYKVEEATGTWNSYGAIVTSPIFQVFNVTIPFNDDKKSCVTTKETYVAANNSVSVETTYKHSGTDKRKYYIEVYKDLAVGKYNVESNDEELEPYQAIPVTVLATDYKSYVIKYSCIFLENVFPYQIISTSIRESSPNGKTLELLGNELTKLGFELKQLHLFCK